MGSLLVVTQVGNGNSGIQTLGQHSLEIKTAMMTADFPAPAPLGSAFTASSLRLLSWKATWEGYRTRIRISYPHYPSSTGICRCAQGAQLPQQTEASATCPAPGAAMHPLAPPTKPAISLPSGATAHTASHSQPFNLPIS